MSAVTQWAVVAAIVVLCAAYAVRALLPGGTRRRLAAWLRARGYGTVAGALAAPGGCDGCGLQAGAKPEAALPQDPQAPDGSRPR